VSGCAPGCSTRRILGAHSRTRRSASCRLRRGSRRPGVGVGFLLAPTVVRTSACMPITLVACRGSGACSSGSSRPSASAGLAGTAGAVLSVKTHQRFLTTLGCYCRLAVPVTALTDRFDAEPCSVQYCSGGAGASSRGVLVYSDEPVGESDGSCMAAIRRFVPAGCLFEEVASMIRRRVRGIDTNPRRPEILYSRR